MNTFPYFPRKWFQLCQSKMCKKVKSIYFKPTQYLFLSSRKLQNPFPASFRWPNFDLITFEHIASLSQKLVSTSSLKNVQKIKNTIFKRPQHLFLSSSKLQNHFLRRFLLRNFDLISFWCFSLLSQLRYSKIWKKSKKCLFQRSRTFLIELEEASKSFSKIIPRTIFWFKQFEMLCLTLSNHFLTQKFANTGKWQKVQKIQFWPQGSFKIVFQNASYEQLWI